MQMPKRYSRCLRTSRSGKPPQCHAILAGAKIPHAVMGGVAVCLHGYQRNTVDVDLLVRKEDSLAVRESLELRFAWNERDREFTSPSGIAVQFLSAGDQAGSGSKVNLPDPGDEVAVTEIEGLPVLRLSKLIESKIACGTGNLRRTHKDFADVVELILQNRLDSSFGAACTSRCGRRIASLCARRAANNEGGRAFASLGRAPGTFCTLQSKVKSVRLTSPPGGTLFLAIKTRIPVRRFHGVVHFVGFDRLGNEIVHSGCQALLAEALDGMRRHGNDGDVAAVEPLLLPNDRRRLQPVHVRHFQVHEHNVERGRCERVSASRPVLTASTRCPRISSRPTATS